MHSSKISLLCLCLIATSVLSGQSVPVVGLVPPTHDESFDGASFTVSPKGTKPMTHQWYRVVSNTQTVKVEGATEATLLLKPPYVAGLYYCVSTNPAGSLKSRTFRLSVTTVVSAADMQIVIKTP